MSHLVRASYGARDNMHALLSWDGPAGSLPAELLGLTDKPPGSYGPGDRWWPSVGCGPVGGWWALWWTEPDTRARRGGMVRSEVALWRLGDTGSLDDLRSVMTLLSAGKAIPAPPNELMRAVADALLSSNPGLPLVTDLDLWPGILAAVWSRLWPEARHAFSARVAISPPQGGESVAPPWLYGVPADRTLQWPGHRVITSGANSAPLHRAACWLVGDTDATLEEVLHACPGLPADLGGLRRAARAADGLETLRTSRDSASALGFLRTMVTLAPSAEAATVLKAEAVDALKRGLPNASASLVRALANLNPSPLSISGTPDEELETWINARGALLPAADTVPLVLGLAPGEAQGWWQHSVHSALAKALSRPNAAWAKAAIHWLGIPGTGAILRDILPTAKEVESALLRVANDMAPTGEMLGQLRLEAEERSWSRLHAWAAMRLARPSDAFRLQRAFPGDLLAGLEILVTDLPGPDVVAEFMARPDAQLAHLVARRTAKEPALLAQIDPSRREWRELWSAHIAVGGACWPPGVNRELLGTALLDAVLQGEEPKGVVAATAPDLAAKAFHHAKRSELWAKLSPDGRAELLPRVAEELLRLCGTAQIQMTDRPEAPLLESLVNETRKVRPSARVIMILMAWDAPLSEEDVIRWLDQPRNGEWASMHEDLGRSVLGRGWKRVAKVLYEHSLRMPELRPAAVICQELLPFFDQFRLKFADGWSGMTQSDQNRIVQKIADLGAGLSPTGLDDLWERAGGERKRLNNSGMPATRWREAAMEAQRGALSDGAPALVRELRRDFPYNEELRSLEEVLSRLPNYQSR